MVNSSSSSAFLGLDTHPPVVRRKSVFQHIGSWLGKDPIPEPPGKQLLEKMPTFKKRVRAGRKRVVYDVGGKKTITHWGAYVYLLNQFLDCLPSLPYVILAAGWVPALIANVFVCAIASFIALMTMRAMTMIEGNQNFELRYEYVPTAQHFLGPTVAICLEVGFHVLQILNFLAINSVSRLIDIMLLKVLGFTAGVSLYPTLSFISVYSGSSLEELYTVSGTSTNAFTVSLGYIVCGVVCIPLSRYNLDEGLSAQLCILGVAIVAISVVIGSAFKTLLSAATLPSLLSVLPSWLLRICRLSANPSVKAAAAAAMSQPTTEDSRILFLQTVAGVDPYSLIKTLAETLDSSALVQLIRSSSLPMMCSPCASTLCKEAAAHHAQSPFLWNPILQYLVAASWKLEKLGPRPAAPSRWGRYQFQRTFGIFIGGYSFTNMVPSWANELQADVEIPKVLWRSTISACVLFFGFGWLLAFAFPDIEDEDALQHIVGNHAVPTYVAFSVYSLELVTVALGVIVNCIATRYNLTNSGVFRSPSTSFFFGCVCPFLFAWIFAVESWTTACFGWAALILSLVCNFVAPAYVYIVACKTSPLAYRNPSRHRTVRLGIEAFVPKRGSVPDVQAALREWALTMTDEDPELRALLESSDADSKGFGLNSSLHTRRRRQSSQSSAGPFSPHRLSVPKLLGTRVGSGSLGDSSDALNGVNEKGNGSTRDRNWIGCKSSVPRSLGWSEPQDDGWTSDDRVENQEMSNLIIGTGVASERISEQSRRIGTGRFGHYSDEESSNDSERRRTEEGSDNLGGHHHPNSSSHHRDHRLSSSSVGEIGPSEYDAEILAELQKIRNSKKQAADSAKLDIPNSAVCLSDIRRRFSVMEIVASYQRAASILSAVAEDAVRESILHAVAEDAVRESIRIGGSSHSSRSSSMSRNKSCHENRANEDVRPGMSVFPAWQSLVVDYERRLAAGELEYTDGEDESESEKLSDGKKSNEKKSNEKKSSFQPKRSSFASSDSRRIGGRYSVSFSDHRPIASGIRSSISSATSYSSHTRFSNPSPSSSPALRRAGRHSTNSMSDVQTERSIIRNKSRSASQPFLMTPDQLQQEQTVSDGNRPRSRSSFSTSEPRALASAYDGLTCRSIDLILLPSFHSR